MRDASVGNNDKIKKILIVGGGTSGWLTAGYLNSAFGDKIEVTLLESSTVTTIGVGEATIPTIKTTMEFIGYKPEEWLPEVNGTFKSAIKFSGWSDSTAKGKESYYYHTFYDRPESSAMPFDSPWFLGFGMNIPLYHYCLKKKFEGSDDQIASYYNPLVQLCENNQSPCSHSDPSLNLKSAYHMDAGLMGKFLREKLTARGVINVVDHLVEVNKNEDGFIKSVSTKGGREIEADLFIDCSGFKGLLINEAMGAEFKSYNDSLLCNSAVAISAKNNPEVDGITPYTKATAINSGWVWDIPLFNRNGCGYVYSNDFINSDGAESELREFLGARCNDMPANHIKMRVGKTITPWVKNCVAIGLSSCFIEPLESTGILLTELGVASLISTFPDKSFCQGNIDRYNSIINKTYDEVKDFIILHYILSKRDDTPFWRAVTNETVVPDSLKEKLEGFESALPVFHELQTDIFAASSYIQILDGYGATPKRPYPLLEQIGYEQGEIALREAKKNIEFMIKNMPDHYEYIKELHNKAGLNKAA